MRPGPGWSEIKGGSFWIPLNYMGALRIATGGPAKKYADTPNTRPFNSMYIFFHKRSRKKISSFFSGASTNRGGGG